MEEKKATHVLDEPGEERSIGLGHWSVSIGE